MHASKLQYSHPKPSSSSPSSSPSTQSTTSSPSSSITPLTLRTNTLDLLTALNLRHYHLLPLFLHASTLQHNSVPSTPTTYIASLRSLIASAPDMSFKLGQMVVDAPARKVACVIAVEGTPAGNTFRGHSVAPKKGGEGKVAKVRYFEHVTWTMDEEGRVCGVESKVDEEAVGRQCGKGSGRKKA